MSLSTYLKDVYRAVYTSLKSDETVSRIRSSSLSSEDKERALSIIKRLAHPSVANAWDAFDIARLCTSGMIPGIPKETLDDARRMISEIKKHYPYVELKQQSLTPPEISENPTNQEIASAISWNNKVMSRMLAMLLQVMEESSSFLKSQCPYCLESMVLTVREEGIFLRCSAGTTAACKKTQWKIFSAESST